MDTLQERIIREGSKGECLYRRRSKQQGNEKDHRNKVNMRDKLSFREVHITRDDRRCRDFFKHNTSKIHSEEMNMAEKLPCKLSEVKPILHNESSSAFHMDTPTLILKSKRSQKKYNNNNYNPNDTSD